MATHRSRALTGSPERRFVRHVPDYLDGTCPDCGTASTYVKGNGRPGTFMHLLTDPIHSPERTPLAREE